jgi:4-hydroxy-tetrahydrodipicolinate reductase
MGPILLRYALEKGADVVAVIDRNAARVGKSVAEVTGLPIRNLVIQPPSEAATLFKKTPVDLCFVATRTSLSEIADQLLLCAKNGINVITISEEAIYPYTTSPTFTAEIDVLARRNKCTVFGSGYTDFAWAVLPSVMAGSVINISKIEGECWYNVNDYGMAEEVIEV